MIEEKNDKKDKKKRNYEALLVRGMCIYTVLSIIGLSIGYSAYNTSLYVGGDTIVRVPDGVRITGVRRVESTNGGEEYFNSKYSKDTTTLGVKLPSLDSTVTYEVTINNDTSIIYEISDIESDIADKTNNIIIDEIELPQVINPGNTTVNITFKYDTGAVLPEGTEQSAVIKFIFASLTAKSIEYDNSNSNTECEDVECALDELYGIIGE